MRSSGAPLVAFLSLVTVLSGCISAADLGDEAPAEPADTTPVTTIVVETQSFQETYSATVNVGDNNLQGPTMQVKTPPTVLDVRLELQRDPAVNDMRLRVEEADGDVTMHDWTGDSLTVTLDDPGVGQVSVHPVAVGAAPPTQVTMDAHVRWLQTIHETSDAVVVVRQGDAYRAEITYFTSHAVGNAVEADVDLFNGDIEIQGTSDDGNASATVTTWARATSEARARALVLDLTMRMSLSNNRLQAIVDDDTDRRDSESIGAHGTFVVPARLEGFLDTSNGDIHLDGVQAKDLALDSSNGDVTGSIAAEGRLAIDTSNGEFDLRLEPTDDLDLDLDTSNGDVRLQLVNDADHSYDLDVDTSNGEVTESMEETSFDATDDDNDEGRLKTNGGSRTIHTSGVVDTSNGDVHFDDA